MSRRNLYIFYAESWIFTCYLLGVGGGVGVEDCGHKTSMQSKRYLDLVTFWQVIFAFFILSHLSVLKHREQIEQNILT